MIVPSNSLDSIVLVWFSSILGSIFSMLSGQIFSTSPELEILSWEILSLERRAASEVGVSIAWSTSVVLATLLSWAGDSAFEDRLRLLAFKAGRRAIYVGLKVVKLRSYKRTWMRLDELSCSILTDQEVDSWCCRVAEIVLNRIRDVYIPVSYADREVEVREKTPCDRPEIVKVRHKCAKYLARSQVSLPSVSTLAALPRFAIIQVKVT